MPIPVQVARFAQMMRRLFSVRGAYDQALLEDLMPVLDLLGLVMPDHLRSRDERLWGIATRMVPSVGNTSSVLINAPKGKLSTILAWAVDSTAGVQLSRSGTAVGAPIRAVPADGRDDFNNGIGTSFEQRTNIALAAAGLFRYSPVAGGNAFLMTPLIMYGNAPGSLPGLPHLGAIIQTESVNSNLNVAVYGVERPVEPSEEIA